MEAKERKTSLGSTQSISGGGLGGGGDLSGGARSLLLPLPSLSPIIQQRRSSSIREALDMAGVSMLEAEDGDSGSQGQRRGSVEGARTLADVMAESDTHLVDQIIKQEMAHHSPAVGAPREGQRASVAVENENNEDPTEEEEPLLAFGATNLLQHLNLALASPALFRLPALAYKWSSPEGSGFLAAYVVLLLLVAHPLSMLEQTLAQFSSLGPTTIFRCLPLLTGVGVGMVGLCAVLMPYSSTVLAWAVRYTLDCLQRRVPWSDCPIGSNSTLMGCPEELSPSEYYFVKTVLGTTDADAHEGSAVVLTLGLTQALVWLALILAVWRGEPWRSGALSKVWSLVTAGVLVVMIVYGFQQPSSGEGLGKVFIFSWRDLGRPDIWLDAFGQVLWAVGPCIGLLINRASYRHFRDRIRLDAYTGTIANLLMAIISCLAVFPYLSSDVEKTPGFFLVESSMAVTKMEVPQVGGAMLYLGLCKSLFDHTQILAYTVTVGVSDLLPGHWRGGGRLFLCCTSVCMLGFIFSLPFATHEGVFLVRALDTYVPWASGLLLGMLEVAGLVYMYGAATISQHFKLMLRRDLTLQVFIWRFLLLPVFLVLGVWACVVGVQGPVAWEDIQLTPEREEVYRVAGVVVAMLPAGLAVLVTVVLLIRNIKHVQRLLVPTEAWGPALVGHCALYTPRILRAMNKAPYLVVQVENEGGENLPQKGWLPFGFYWVPSKSEMQLLPSCDGPTKTLLVKYLKSRFSHILQPIGEIEEEEEENGHEETEAVELWVMTEVGTEVMQEGSNLTISSGVLLQPKSLTEDRAQHLHR